MNIHKLSCTSLRRIGFEKNGGALVGAGAVDAEVQLWPPLRPRPQDLRHGIPLMPGDATRVTIARICRQGLERPRRLQGFCGCLCQNTCKLYLLAAV